jgi:Skp family chaperone for outer membrane proteins
MASFEEKLESLDHTLTRVIQTQELGQAHLEQALTRVEGLIPVAGAAVASAMTASANQAAQAHLAALMRVVDEVVTASKGTVAEASKAVQELRQSLQAEVQASQGMLKAVNAEADKASGLMKRMGEQGTQGEETLKAIHVELVALGQSVGAHKVQMNTAIKEAESEAKKELGSLRERIHDLIPGYLAWFREGFNAVVVVLCLNLVLWGAYYAAKIYVEKNRTEEIRAEVVKEVRESLVVRAVAYTVVPKAEGGVRVEPQGIQVPLVMQEDGSFQRMKRTADGRWAWGRYMWSPEQVYTAQAWDSKTGTVLKADLPQ